MTNQNKIVFPTIGVTVTPDEHGMHDFSDANEIEYDSVTDVLQIGVFGFCGCGLPDENVKLIVDGLRLLKESSDRGAEERKKIPHEEWYPDWDKRMNSVFESEASKYFFYYWCDKEELTEHGGSVPGWLTDKGVEVLRISDQFGE